MSRKEKKEEHMSIANAFRNFFKRLSDGSAASSYTEQQLDELNAASADAVARYEDALLGEESRKRPNPFRTQSGEKGFANNGKGDKRRRDREREIAD